MRTKFLSSPDTTNSETMLASGEGPAAETSSNALPIDASELPPSVAPPDPLVGRVIDGRYYVDAILGQGGMGIVYRGRHKVIDKKVAIKVLRGDMARDQEVTDRFLQEAKSASAIGNPHIIDISDFGVLPEGSTYFVMEYLQGMSLSSLLEQERPLPLPRLIAIAKQIAQGLAAAHAAGIVHRDLKPDNIMLINRGTEKDFVKILDFGIAKVGGESSKLTRAGSVFGTPHYMSPEQAAGAPVNQGTDIYSLGIIMYELASGKVPFDAENFMGILTMHMYKAPPPMLALIPQPDVPPGLDAIVQKCLSKKVELRYLSMDELIADLEKLEKGGMPNALAEMMARSGGFNVPSDYFRNQGGMPAPVPASPPQKAKRWPLYAGVAGVLAAVGIVVGIFAKSEISVADSKKSASQITPSAATAPVPPTIATPVATITPPLASEVHTVVVALDPADAKATLDGKEQKNPVILPLKTGETAKLLVSRSGYVPQTITINSDEGSRLIKLVPQAASTVKPPGTHGNGPARSGGNGSMSIDSDPWKH